MTPDETLIDACIYGTEKRAKAALADGASVTYRSPKSGHTAFHCAASNGHRALASMLLKRGADVRTKDDDGCTPLFDLVAYDDDVETTKFLLDAGSEVDAANKDGWTPLLVACTWDERWNELVALLLRRGANVNHIARDDWTPLMLAFHCNSRGGPDTVLLKDKRLDLNLVTPHFGWTPLLHAAAGSNLEAVRTLLARGAKLDARMKISPAKPHASRAILAASNVSGAIRAKPEHDGFTPLHWAVLKKRRCQKLLLEAGADPRAKSRSGKTPLSLGLPPPAPVAAKSGGHEQSLLAAIAVKPNDDQLRLVYADWLLEQGNPWGEVVQLAVTVARLAPDAAQRPVLLKQLAALEKKHANAFLGALAPFLRRPKFERGLLCFAACDAGLFPSAAAAIADRAPGATVQLTALKPKGHAALFAAPLGRFACIVLEENRLDDAAIERLAASESLQGLKALRIGRNPFSDLGALALAKSPHLSEMRALDVSLTWPKLLSTATVGSLVSSPKLPRLESLVVSCAGPGVSKALEKCTAPLRELTVFDLTHFEDSDAVALGRLKQLKTLQRLELRPSNERSGLALTDVGAKALLHSSTFTLRHLELHDADHLSEAMQQQVAECNDTREAR